MSFDKMTLSMNSSLTCNNFSMKETNSFRNEDKLKNRENLFGSPKLNRLINEDNKLNKSFFKNNKNEKSKKK